LIKLKYTPHHYYFLKVKNGFSTSDARVPVSEPMRFRNWNR